MQDNYSNIALSLAGIFQAIALVRELTQTGKITHEDAFCASILSIFQTQAADVPSVYGGMPKIQLGLKQLIHTFSANQKIDPLQSRYIMSLIHLQKKLYRSPDILHTLTKRIQQTQKQVNYFSLTHPTVITNLADIYLNTVSTFKLRVIIFGNERILNVRENMDKIRALLLAGIRSAVLWRQSGGSRLQFLFSRGKIKASAEKLLII